MWDSHAVRSRWPVVVIGIVIALAFGPAACGGDDDGEAGATAPGEKPNSATGSTPEETGALDGTWRTSSITIDEMTRTLREHGLGDWVARFERNAPVSNTPTALVLEIRDGSWDLYGRPRGGQREEIDYDAQYEVDGDNVVVSHEGDSNTYRWAVEGESLKLAWLETTYGRNNGIPEEVFQRALYMTADFRRAG
jgi:hypothetical protein